MLLACRASRICRGLAGEQFDLPSGQPDALIQLGQPCLGQRDLRGEPDPNRSRRRAAWHPMAVECSADVPVGVERGEQQRCRRFALKPLSAAGAAA